MKAQAGDKLAIVYQALRCELRFLRVHDGVITFLIEPTETIDAELDAAPQAGGNPRPSFSRRIDPQGRMGP